MSFKKQILEDFSQSQGWQGKCLLSITTGEVARGGKGNFRQKMMLAQ